MSYSEGLGKMYRILLAIIIILTVLFFFKEKDSKYDKAWSDHLANCDEIILPIKTMSKSRFHSGFKA
jgi:hypothetical protein